MMVCVCVCVCVCAQVEAGHAELPAEALPRRLSGGHAAEEEERLRHTQRHRELRGTNKGIYVQRGTTSILGKPFSSLYMYCRCLQTGGFTVCVHQVTSLPPSLSLLQRIITKIRSLPGNDKCADCSCPEPEWLSVNLGILTCINCCGRHRELSVQYSRIRSLKLDKIKTTELLVRSYMCNRRWYHGGSLTHKHTAFEAAFIVLWLISRVLIGEFPLYLCLLLKLNGLCVCLLQIALVMGNGVLNEVLEANLTDPKPSPDATTYTLTPSHTHTHTQHPHTTHTCIGNLLMRFTVCVFRRDQRQEFIVSKYMQRKYIEHTIGKESLLQVGTK